MPEVQTSGAVFDAIRRCEKQIRDQAAQLERLEFELAALRQLLTEKKKEKR